MLNKKLKANDVESWLSIEQAKKSMSILDDAQEMVKENKTELLTIDGFLHCSTKRLRG